MHIEHISMIIYCIALDAFLYSAFKCHDVSALSSCFPLRAMGFELQLDSCEEENSRKKI